MSTNMSIQDRFWSKVDVRGDDECWEWQGCLSVGKRGGYGEFRCDGKVVRAHRFSWELIHGKIEGGLFVCHKCDNRKCVNPNHLFLGTVQDNNLDRDKKGRASVTHLAGEKHPLHKLTIEQVLEIQASPLSQRILAKIYGVGQSHIQRVKTKQVWKYVTTNY